MARKTSKARKVLEKPQVLGWKTSDAEADGAAVVIVRMPGEAGE